eukprot:6186900-Prymnesium_polylepis.1
MPQQHVTSSRSAAHRTVHAHETRSRKTTVDTPGASPDASLVVYSSLDLILQRATDFGASLALLPASCLEQNVLRDTRLRMAP